MVDTGSHPGGFSPGVAERVVAANGRRGLVKAVSPAQNAHSSALLRREIEVLASMAAEVGLAALLASYDDGDWVALLSEDKLCIDRAVCISMQSAV